MAERLSLRLAQERGQPLQARSCGIAAEGYFAVPPEIWRALAEAGVERTPHRPQLVGRELLAWADEALVMTARQRDFLIEAFPEHRRKVALLTERAGLPGEIDDPIGKSWVEYRECRRLLSAALERLLK